MQISDPGFGAGRMAVAPMLDVTDSIFRRLIRVYSRRIVNYTEMVAADAIVHEKYHLLDYDPVELPCVLQLGGSSPKKLALAAKIGSGLGYSAVNLNAGCPSDKVQAGAFGAALLKNIPLLCDCFKAMADAASCEVTVKTRIGYDHEDSFEFTCHLVDSLYNAGCRHLILHARKAWLTGLSPRENRSIPPLDYGRVYKMKEMYPDLRITLNGGITTLEQCRDHLEHVDGVMLGRALCDNPYLLSAVDREIFGEDAAVPSREELLARFVPLTAVMLSEGRPLHLIVRHLMNLFAGCPGSRLYRRYLSEHMTRPGEDETILERAWQAMRGA